MGGRPAHDIDDFIKLMVVQLQILLIGIDVDIDLRVRNPVELLAHSPLGIHAPFDNIVFELFFGHIRPPIIKYE